MRDHESEVVSGYCEAITAIRAADEILARRNREAAKPEPKQTD